MVPNSAPFGTMTSPVGPPPDPDAMDALLAQIDQQIQQNNQLDPSDRDLIEKMVAGLGDTRGMVRLQFAEYLGKAIGKPAVS